MKPIYWLVVAVVLMIALVGGFIWYNKKPKDTAKKEEKADKEEKPADEAGSYQSPFLANMMSNMFQGGTYSPTKPAQANGAAGTGASGTDGKTPTNKFGTPCDKIVFPETAEGCP